MCYARNITEFTSYHNSHFKYISPPFVIIRFPRDTFLPLSMNEESNLLCDLRPFFVSRNGSARVHLAETTVDSHGTLRVDVTHKESF